MAQFQSQVQESSAAYCVQTKRLLLIEDNLTDVVLLKKMLYAVSKREEFSITDVPRMVDAIELLDDALFDVVLLDLNLVDIYGLAAVSALHAQVPAIPIIVYSGAQDPQLREGALLCGAKQYLVKGRESAFSLKFTIEQALSPEAAH